MRSTKWLLQDLIVGGGNDVVVVVVFFLRLERVNLGKITVC